MAGFVSGEAVKPLDYDFSAHGGPTGVVPEPSSEAMNRFLHDIGTITQKMLDKRGEGDLVDQSNPASVIAAMAQMDEKEAKAADGAMLDAVARLCGARCVKGRWQGGSPTRAELGALPARVGQAFVGWIMGELFRPEGLAAVSASQGEPNGGSIPMSAAATSG